MSRFEWLQSLLIARCRKDRGRSAARTRNTVRLVLDGLEDRLLLSAPIIGLNSTTVQTMIAYGINDNGDVVGEAQGSAFLYNGTTTVPIPGTGTDDIAYDINDSNQVVGVTASEQAFFSNNGGTPTPIGDVFSDNPVGPPFVGINSSGDVVGQQNPSGDAFLYNGTMNIIGPTSGFQSSAAYGINDKGQEVGFVQGENADNHAALFYGNGQWADLGALNGDNYSVANAINDSGEVVGYSSSSGGGSGNRPFLWIPSSPNATTGTMIPIGTSEGVANGINSAGWVVGQESTSSGLDAFVYRPAQNGAPGQMIDLNNLPAVKNAGWTLTDAYAINDNNYIVGTGYGPNGQEAFLLNFNAAAGGVGGVGTITTLASFNGNSYGSYPSGVIMDGSGNLYSTLNEGGSSGYGSVLELAKGSSTITTLASFNGTNGTGPGGLIMDGSGNLYGTTYGATLSGGSPGDGTVFELAKGSSTITTLASFNGTNGTGPGGLIMDGSGNLYGTTESGGASDAGTIFELTKGSSYIITLASFNSTNGGSVLPSSLIMDGSGNLYGTTLNGGLGGRGSIFELAKGSSTITTLASFNSSVYPSGMIMDGSGNLFGTTGNGGASGDGSVFELAKGSSTITTLASFNGTNGTRPLGLIMDGNGNLYGTTIVGGSSNEGTVFELAKGSSTITTVASFNGNNGDYPDSGLILDGSGNLYGTTAPGGPADEGGTIFEVQKSTSATTAPVITSGNSAILTVGQTAGFTVTATGSPTPTLTESGALPSGVTFTDNGTGTASLSGTPAPNTNGTYYVMITAHNGIGSDFAQNFTLTVNPSLPPPPHVYPPPNVPSLLAFFDSLFGGVQTDNADGTETITDRLFGIPLLVSTFDSSGNLESILLFGINVTALFDLL